MQVDVRFLYFEGHSFVWGKAPRDTLLVLVLVFMLVLSHHGSLVALFVVAGGEAQPEEGGAKQGHLGGIFMYTCSIYMHGGICMLCAERLEEEVGAATHEVDHRREEVHLTTHGGVMDTYAHAHAVSKAAGYLPMRRGVAVATY